MPEVIDKTIQINIMYQVILDGKTTHLIRGFVKKKSCDGLHFHVNYSTFVRSWSKNKKLKKNVASYCKLDSFQSSAFLLHFMVNRNGSMYRSSLKKKTARIIIISLVVINKFLFDSIFNRCTAASKWILITIHKTYTPSC